ncbi:MAG TPA: ribosome biogenesis GTP-binding protein YihA/YsxC [Pyrinomonadaceae bacterium]|nr:ribosome biogenesis GTP-binding protein YihA/YsxC [Pyrinomonadaceae bacterium]
MKVTSAEFLKSAFEESHWPPEDMPEVAFLGRSNVGKSSLINSMLGVRGLARTSSTPGRTQALNFFLINRSFRFVDLPGYGYARVPKAIRQSWGAFVTNYLAKRASLVLSIQIVDSRHEPTTLDLQLREWLRANGKPFLTVATKSDKLSHNELRKSLARARQVLGADEASDPSGRQAGGEIVTYSAVTGRGRDQLWRAIEEAITGS